MTGQSPASASRPEIGGYFGLDLPPSGSNPHAGALALNSARNGLLYLLHARRPRRVHLPSYICDSMLQPLRQAGVAHRFYAIDERLEIARPPRLAPSELLLYVNYFGVKSGYCRQLTAHYGGALVVDDSQALYADPLPGVATLYSPRKFVGVSDGGYLYLRPDPCLALDRDASSEAASHLTGRPDESAQAFYPAFLAAERRLDGRPLRRMSALTTALLNHFDHPRARLVREQNFRFLHAALARHNRLPIEPADAVGPMVYPFWTGDRGLRERLLAERVYTATYWADVRSRPEAGVVERRLVEELVPLPIDQRYGIPQMQFILGLVDAPLPRCAS